MNISEIFLITWAVLATVLAVYYHATRRYFIVQSAVLRTTLALLASGEATIGVENGEVKLTGFSGMLVEDGKVVSIERD